MRAKRIKTIKVQALAGTQDFVIDIKATVTNKGKLDNKDMDKIRSKLKHYLSQDIPKLPFSDIYPYEVDLK